MKLTKQDIIDLSEVMIRAIGDCREILIAAAERPDTPPPAPPPPITPTPSVMTRTVAVQFLKNSVGYPVAVSTLAKLAVHGGGPPYQKFGSRVVYRTEDLRAWAEGRSRRRTSTSDNS